MREDCGVAEARAIRTHDPGCDAAGSQGAGVGMIRHPMRRRSNKAIAKEAARTKCIRTVAKRDGYRCRAKIKGVCTGDYEDVHELVMRSAGGSITDPDNCIAVCRRCHSWLHLHKPEACDLGLIRSPKHEGRRNPFADGSSIV